MISVLLPGFLLAGAGLAGVVGALHLLARRPPAREALPTARFLKEDARTLLRLQPRPTDVPLMMLRMGLVLCLAAAFAGMVWTPGRSGEGHVVLLDAGAGSGLEWDSAISLVAEATAGANGAESVVVAYGLEDGAREVDIASLGSLERGTEAATAEDGLRALREVVLADTRFSIVRAEWVLVPTWSSWNDGVGLMRPAIWPGRLPIHAVPSARAGGSAPSAGSDPTRGRRASVVGLAADTLELALGALGVPVGPVREAPPRPGDWVFGDGISSTELGALLERARSGEIVVISGRLPEGAAGVPWVGDATPKSRRQGLVVPGEPGFASGVESFGGTPAEGAAVVAVFADATPAAAAVSTGAGCVVYLSVSVADGALHGSSNYPELLRRLTGGCSDRDVPNARLGRGAIASLQRDDLPDVVDVAGLAADQGVPLSKWWVALALVLLGGELAMTRSRRMS